MKIKHLFLLSFFILQSCASAEKTAKSDTKCIPPILSTTDTRLYQPRTNITPPLEPWHKEFELPQNPSNPDGGYYLYAIQRHDNVDEIWIGSGSWEGVIGASETYANYLVYYANTGKFKKVFSQIDNLETPAPSVLLPIKNGDIFGMRTFNNSAHNVPIIVKLNRSEQRFENIIDSSNLLTTDNLPRIDSYTVDANEQLWMISGEYLYKFDLKSFASERYPIIDNERGDYLSDIAFSPDEGILYLIAIGQPNLISFSIEKERVVETLPISLPIGQSYYQENKLAVSRMFLDSSRRLWVHDYGWMEQDKKWYPVISRFSGFYGHLEDAPYDLHGWLSTKLIFESSDGRLWFRSDNGTAWLNPAKSEWCWFTTYQSNIVEDSDHNLWMIADGKLYKNPLGK